VLCSAGLWLPHHAQLYGSYTMALTWVIAVLLIIVSASYRQTIFGYPGGGGSYIVARKNLGRLPGLIAAAALLIDYTLTVSVSVASGIQNIKDVPALASLKIGDHMILYCILAILFMTYANLRGLRESGRLLAAPVYSFIIMCFLMIIIGLVGPYVGWQFHSEFVNQIVPDNPAQPNAATNAAEIISTVVLLRAFANGCAALTGIEAVSNGIPVFKEPKTKNAATTLLIMSVILGCMFVGVSWLSVHFHVVYWENNGVTAPAVIDQLSGTIFGKTGMWSWAYMLTQISTAVVLVIAAQTSFGGFPRLASILAHDGFMPRQLMNLGDKLAFNNGIIMLGFFSSLLIVMEKGSVDRLIPFFAIGVFMAFTLSQTGMVRHWIKDKTPGWQWRSFINGAGALACFIVVIDIVTEKFLEGAWMVLVVIGILLFMFFKISGHYKRMITLLNPANYRKEPRTFDDTVLVLVQGVHVGTLTALDYARSISHDCTAVYVALDPDPERVEVFKSVWEKYVPDVELVILDSPYRSLIEPITCYLDMLHKEKPNRRLTVVIPEFVTSKWWQGLLHGNTGLLLKLALLGRQDVIVANVRYWLKGS
jgi:amino acid transporter